MHNTGNPVPSVNPLDRQDNSEALDGVMNSNADTVKGRLGQNLSTAARFNRIVSSALSQVAQIVATVNSAADGAIEEMEATAAALGDDLNNKYYHKYSEMVADPQVRDGVTAIVDGDPDSNLDGWYRWKAAGQQWQRIERQPLMSGGAFSNKDLFSLIDANNMETWLGVNSVDGGPSEHSERLMRLMFGIFSQGRTGYLAALADANGLMTDFAIRDTDGQFDDFVMDRMAPRINQRIPDKIEAKGRTGYLFCVTDTNGVVTDLCVDDATGQFPPFVVERLARRIVPYLPGTGDSAWLTTDRYADEKNKSHRIFADPLSWSGWGSSTIDEWSELGTVAGDFGASYYNGGQGGTELQHHLAQLGARPAMLLPVGGEIPESGPVVVTCDNVTPTAAFRAVAGTLAGVPGSLASSATQFTFTRFAPGAAVPMSEAAPLGPTQGAIHRGDTWLMNAGKNDINNGRPMANTLAMHDEMYAFNSALNKRVIVMTHFGHTGNANKSHTAKCTQLSDYIRANYGSHVFDLGGYLFSQQVWVDTGITPTAADLQNQADKCMPASLSRDNMAHMNATTRRAAANKLKAQLISMGWFKE